MNQLQGKIKYIKTSVFILILLAFVTSGVPAQGAPGTSAQSCILAEADSGMVLYENNADTSMLIASTTKMLTALVVLDKCDMRECVLIGDDFPAVEGSSIYIKPGEAMTVGDLLYGLMLASGNDAAVALALYVSGSVEAFAQLMNARAQAIGCTGSHFVNPHGLDDEGHYSTARDLWLIAREAMDNSSFYEIVSTKTITAAGRSLKNHNKLLWNCPGAVGIKTGYTESAGRSLVSCSERDGMRLICVTLNAPDDWSDHTSLYDWAYENYKLVKVSKSSDELGTLPVISGLKYEVAIKASEDFVSVYPKSDTVTILQQSPRFIYAPVQIGQKAGVLTIVINGEPVKDIPIVFGEDVALDSAIPLTNWEKLKRFLVQEEETAVILNE